MKYAVLFLLLLVAKFSIAGDKTSNPFLTLKYDGVAIYDYNAADRGEVIVDKNGQLTGTIIKQIGLDADEVKELNRRLGLKSSYGNTSASCFIPHLGIVYYQGERIVAHISICLSCNRLDASMEIPAMNQGKEYYEKEVYYSKQGMSDDFRKFLNGLVMKYGFSHSLGKKTKWEL